MKINEIEFDDSRVVKLHSGVDGLRELMAVKVSAMEDSDCLTMCASNARIDRYKEVIDQNGWNLTDYKNNPVIQDSHQYGSIACTIGTALSTEVKDGALIQVWKFASSINPLSKLARDMYAKGFLHASSVGFIPTEAKAGEKGSGCARIFTKSDLLEVSAVGIPANPDALALAAKAGAVDKGDISEAYKLLKHLFHEKENPKTDASAQGLRIDGALVDAVERLHKAMR